MKTKRASQTDRYRDRILQDLTVCMNRVSDRKIFLRLHRIRNSLQMKTDGYLRLPVLKEMEAVLSELDHAAAKEAEKTTESCVSRLEELEENLCEDMHEKLYEAMRGNRMEREKRSGLIVRVISKMKEIFGTRESAGDRLLHGHEEKTELYIGELRAKVEAERLQYERLKGQLERKVKECTAFSEDDYRYKILRQETASLFRKIKSAENRIEMYLNELENSDIYLETMKNGRMLEDIKKYAVDSAEVEVIMQKLSGEAQEIRSEQDDFGKVVSEKSAEIEKVFSESYVTETPEIDRMIEKERRQYREETE